ncbi:MAG: transglycosylase SLT domain-containing protein [Bacteriovorax sp.]
MKTEIKKNIFFMSIFMLVSGCATRPLKKDLMDRAVADSEPVAVELAIHAEPKVEPQSQLKPVEVAKETADEVKEVSQKYQLGGVAVPEANKLKPGNAYYLSGAEDLNLEFNYFDIPVVYNKQVRKWIDYYRGRGREYFELHAERAGRYAPVIGSILAENGLPRDLIFLAMAESGFNNSAKSSAKAVGTWQFMPATGKNYSLTQNWYVDERRDPIKATVAAAQYLAKLYNDFGDWEIATAAYNAGEGKLGRAIKKYKSTDFWQLAKGRYLKSETKNYVPKIMALAIIGKNLKTFGFHNIDFHEPLDFDVVSVKPQTDLFRLSEALKVDAGDIQRLNPELLRWFTPLNVDSYQLRLPPKTAEEFKICCQNMDLIAKDFQEFTVNKKKMSLAQISRKFKIKNSYVLSQLNSVNLKASFRKGEKIKLPFRSREVVSASNRFYTDLFETPKRKKSKRTKKSLGIHTVKKGESLYSIARKHKTSVQRLRKSNSIASSRRIYVGTKLLIR